MTRRDPGPDGVLVVDKPPGWTSHDVVARVRRMAGTRRVGHAGSLDPMATGVLVVGLGRGTRLLGHLAATRKTYAGTARLGLSTSTDDAHGEPLVRSGTGGLDETAVRAAAAGLVGDLMQVPSSVSAVKVDGRRAYARVRGGEQVHLEPRPVTVHRLDVRAVRAGSDGWDLDLEVECSSGTYVRALARDLGIALGVGGHLTRLRRTAVGPFTLAGARTLDQLERAGVRPMSMADAAVAVFPAAVLDPATAASVSHGRALDPAPPGPDETVALLDQAGMLLALYARRDGRATAIAVFAGS